MGMYVNPKEETKEEFLARDGILVPSCSWGELPSKTLPVVLVDNGVFTAAAVCYKSSELEEFTRTTDIRPRKIYLVKIERLLDVVLKCDRDILQKMVA